MNVQLLLKFRRVTIRGAQPSARLSEEICLSGLWGGLSEGSTGALRGLSDEGSAGLCGGPWDFPRFSGRRDPMLVTLRNFRRNIRCENLVKIWGQTFPPANKALFFPCAQHINVGHSHPPRKNHPKMPMWDPQNKFSGVPRIGLFLALLYSL